MLKFLIKYIELIVTAMIGLGFFFLGVFNVLDYLEVKVVLFSGYLILAVYVINQLIKIKHKKIADTN